MKIAVVILNWNGKKLLEKFLPSVISNSKEASIYIADNASTDDSVSFVRSTFPEINIIENSENSGYAKGYNEALKKINEDVFCLLNSDIEVTKDWLKPILETFEEEPNTAIIQPKILDYYKRDHFEYSGAAGGYIDKYGYPYCRGRIFDTIEKDEGQFDDKADIFWSSGACLFIRKEVFTKLKGMDEAYFAHMEEIDLCWRAQNIGYDIRFVGASSVYHIGGATLKNTNPKKTYLNFRNSLYNLVKNADGNWISLLLIRLILDGLAGIKFILELKFRHFIAIIKAHVSFYRHLSYLLKQRKALKQSKNYFNVNSIVWSYFVMKKNHFKSL